ncbi:pentatricopeptide repeat-containing protein At3g22670, mitochondrial isoform X2 [Syzygium oleosum]|uniref:pentatricopeptide repeat-containing protein At3g22670, mitochondrial isoform X2 n=1 Tax=Syzygium oleosum TaxID=219896 RepID=UPI0024BAC085|nr:pentatricopeptide repeat-containing protein At3g22670, mitochondrial isoform X2 [Syzygium oleosum]
MLSKSQIAKLLSCSVSQRKTELYVASSCYLCNSFCSVTKPPERNESPEIPSWVKSLDDKSHGSPDAEDNFVIPSLASWVKSYGPYGRTEVAKVTSSDIGEINVEKVCKLLRNRYSSPDCVVAALNASGVGSSSSMIERILKKFSNDWIPAFGVFTWAKLQMGHHHPSVLCDLMVDILGKSSKFHLMWKLVEEMKTLEVYVTLATMSKVMRRLARADKMKRALPWSDQVDVISSDGSSSSDAERETTDASCGKFPAIAIPIGRNFQDSTSEGDLLKRAKMYQQYMNQITVPTRRGSVIPFTSWMGLGKSIKQLYGQPLHYLTNVQLKQWDQERIGSEAEDEPLDTIIHPSKAEAMIWLVEEVHRRTSSHYYIAKLWKSDPLYHTCVDSVFPEL